MIQQCFLGYVSKLLMSYYARVLLSLVLTEGFID
ncbi:Uncharacterised protein [Legionella cincinnatiensis]|uniref:Uncharacterized protein n=1 Tax=Legionella cincinnatiensis TaxID=28085 RepID=A0A378IH14_9GAMM|nr:Uncharacterised protein [Legionella cincinnatiensis]